MRSASAALLPVGPVLGCVLAVLLAVAVVVTATARLSPDQGFGRGREVLTAGARAAVQLAAVSAVIGWVVHHGAALSGFVLLMYAAAVRTAGRRITSDSTWWWAGVPIAAGVLPAVVLLLATGLLPPRGIALIPVTGILIGGALTATVLAGRQSLAALEQRHGEVEAGFAIGMTDRDARIEIARPAASDSLVPGLDQTRTVGLVTLPGAFVGMLLGGADALTAGAVQLFVLIALMAVQAVAVTVTLELVARARITAPRRAAAASAARRTRFTRGS
ncbi:putative ABC transport system permease protein [Streptomyces sp. KhCrAH-43]|uniref:ABC transporter permease n=1 Tax=unclassified Streptomyces TaxID=2593676 RepID=UPI00037A7DC7|nr:MULTISPECIES: ABC transporter permease [unclassified Streptomyces]MYS37529.1 ABC transporter permease [Streptomyces sp. SID4920]MYX67908.1 ABC transporter permease [Streptomyces sp. SID8373]RAJ56921.1 putative ABC transport system permease protein [Streptomyces sp. KhCrAH-43]